MELNPQASEIYRSFLAGAMAIALGYLPYQAFTHHEVGFAVFAALGGVLLVAKTGYVVIRANQQERN